MYALIKNDTVEKYPYTPTDLRRDNPTISLPRTISEEILEMFGVVVVFNTTPPDVTNLQILDEVVPVFSNGRWEQAWSVRNKTQNEIDNENITKWNSIRSHRDSLMKDFEWRISRYYRQTRLNITPIDDIQELDDYMQALADITLQQDPDNIIWPTPP